MYSVLPLKITLTRTKTSFVSELKKAWLNNIPNNTIESFYYHINYKITRYTGASMGISAYRLPKKKIAPF